MNIVMIIPTGIGCEIGGHNGDATPVARMLGEVVDKIILHPNVVNASDINEMPENALYVEGSILDRFLAGGIGLQEVKRNKILLVVNYDRAEIYNSVSAARVTLGADIEIMKLNTKLKMFGDIVNGRATGSHSGVGALIDQVKSEKFDALAISSYVDISQKIRMNYYKNGGVNPWGYVEAMVSNMVANGINKPVAHAPHEIIEDNEEMKLFWKAFNMKVDPRTAPEMVSASYLHCVLKGLNKAPRIIGGWRSYGGCRAIWSHDIDYLVSPPCWGPPHEACLKNNIPIIFVESNKNNTEFPLGVNDPMPEGTVMFNNYLEVAGVLAAEKSGTYWRSCIRPIDKNIVR